MGPPAINFAVAALLVQDVQQAFRPSGVSCGVDGKKRIDAHQTWRFKFGLHCIMKTGREGEKMMARIMRKMNHLKLMAFASSRCVAIVEYCLLAALR